MWVIEMNGIGPRIRELRVKYKMRQGELANKLGLSRQIVSNWEREYTLEIPSAYIGKLAEIFDVSCDYIITGKYKPLSQEEKELSELIVTNPDVKTLLKSAKRLDRADLKRVIKYIEFVILGE